MFNVTVQCGLQQYGLENGLQTALDNSEPLSSLVFDRLTSKRRQKWSSVCSDCT